MVLTLTKEIIDRPGFDIDGENRSFFENIFLKIDCQLYY